MVHIGDFDRPVLAFGGSYGNLEATQAVLEAADRAGIPAERTICTGDAVAHCADPGATVALIRDAGIVVVMGNCEESLSSRAAECGCGYAQGSQCDIWSAQWFAFCAARLSADAKRWMGALPRSVAFTLAGRRFHTIHGGVTEINRYVFASTSTAVKAAEIAEADAEGVIGGHCGLPFTERIGDTLWHNPGVIGLPANDGTTRSWYSVLTPAAGGIDIAHHALAFDHAAAAAKIKAVPGLPRVYAGALESGRWPNMDILPEAERAAAGRALAPARMLWPHPAGRRR